MNPVVNYAVAAAGSYVDASDVLVDQSAVRNVVGSDQVVKWLIIRFAQHDHPALPQFFHGVGDDLIVVASLLHSHGIAAGVGKSAVLDHAMPRRFQPYNGVGWRVIPAGDGVISVGEGQSAKANVLHKFSGVPFQGDKPVHYSDSYLHFRKIRICRPVKQFSGFGVQIPLIGRIQSLPDVGDEEAVARSNILRTLDFESLAFFVNAVNFQNRVDPAPCGENVHLRPIPVLPVRKNVSGYPDLISRVCGFRIIRINSLSE